MRGVHRSPVNSPAGQWRGALKFSLICAWINRWVNNREAGDLRRYRAHYGVIVMKQNYIHQRDLLKRFYDNLTFPSVPVVVTSDNDEEPEITGQVLSSSASSVEFDDTYNITDGKSLYMDCVDLINNMTCLYGQLFWHNGIFSRVYSVQLCSMIPQIATSLPWCSRWHMPYTYSYEMGRIKYIIISVPICILPIWFYLFCQGPIQPDLPITYIQRYAGHHKDDMIYS